MHRSKKRRNIIIISLIGVLLCMVVGYAAFQTKLEISGTTKVTSNWDIEITNVTSGTPTGTAENAAAPSWDATTASMEANLYDKGDAMEYDVTIENKGTIDAKLNDILTNLEKENNDAVIITFLGYTKGEVLKAKNSKIVHVKIAYNPEYEGEETSSEVEINFDYVQEDQSTDVPDTYLLTYDYATNGGDRVDSEGEYLTSGSNVDLSNKAYKTGWTFVGWNTDKDAEVGLTSYQMKETSTTLYAIYSKTLKATYEKGEHIESISKIEDSCTIYNNESSCEITLPTITPSEGYAVDGWYNGSNKVGDAGAKYNLVKNITLTSKVEQNEYTVTYDYKTNGGSSATKTSDKVAYGENIDLTPTATKSGWTFVGWNTNKDATTKLSSLKMNTGNVTLYAIYRKEAKTVTITFNKNGATSQTPSGGSATSNETLTQSCTIAAVYNNATQGTTCNITSPTITASSNTPTVVGYNTNASGTTSTWNQKTVKAVSANATYYAITKKDAKTITVNFNANGASSIGSTSQSCTIAATYNGTAQGTTCSITSPSITAASGFEVLGWNTSSGSTNSAWSQNTSKSFSANTTYYAITKSSSQYTASFNANGATSIGSTSQSCYRYNGASSCTVTTPTITRSGFTITGWGTSSSATTAEVKAGASLSLSANKTYYAVTSKTVTVTYNKGAHVSSIGSASGTCTIQNSATNCQVTLPSITASTGYTSVGWSTTNGATTGTAAGSKLTVSSNATYYANAVDKTAPTTPTITNSSNGAWTSGSVTITVKSTDEGSGIDHYEWYESGEWTTRALNTENGVGTITFTADRNLNIQFRAIDNAGNISSVATTPVKIDTKNPTVSASTTAKTNSITVVANASAASGISKYEYSKDGGKTWAVGTGNTYTFNSLTAGQTYDIVVRVTSTVGKQATSDAVEETTSSISKPAFSESGTTSKTVTITYPSGCGSSLTCTYQKDDGSSVNVTSTSVQVSFTDSGTLKATVTDGINTVSSSYTVKVGRTVTYNYSTNGGTSATKTSATVEEGSSIDLTPTAIKSGWTFVGWNTNKDATTKLSSLTMGSSNVTLYAIYKKEAKTITITFNKNGATSQTPSGGSANTGTSLTQSCTIAAVYNNATQATTCNITSPTITAPSATPTVVGYNTSASGTTSAWNQNTAKAVSANATYYAITKKDAVTLTAKFNANGASLSSTSNQTCTLAASYNGKAQATSCSVTAPTITRSGYTIIGYNTSASSTSNNSSYNTSSKALTVTTSNNNSTWYAVTSKKVTITFDKNGASAIGSTSQSCTMYNTNTSCNVTSPSITASTNTPTVIGWSTAAGTHSNQWSVSTSKAVSADDTYYAQTSKAAKTITVTFNKNNATSQTPSGGTANTNASLTQSCSIAATYNGTAQATTCNITSPTITAPSATPTVVGYNTSASGTTSAWNQKTSKAVSANATYYAITRKDAKTITVNFNANGASSVGSTSKSCTIAATYNGTAQGTTCSITSPSITAASGFTVLGWNTSSGSTSSAWSQNTAKSFSANTTYYAITKSSSQYTATFNANGATIGSTSQSCYRYNGASSCSITTPTITRSGFTITGWGTSAGATTAAVKASTSLSLTANATYYAVTSKVVTVTYSKGTNVSAIGSTSGTCTIRNSATNCQVTLPTITPASTYVANGWYNGTTKAGNAGAKYTVSSNVTLTSQAVADTITLSISTSSTTKSITVTATASATSGSITKYEYSKDGGSTWVNGGTNKTYTFSGLTHGTSYNIQVRVTSASGKTATKSVAKATTSITKPTFTETNNGEVVITYPSGCGSTYTCTYQKDSSTAVTVTGNTTVYFGTNGTLVAKVSDGTNTVSSTYTVTRNALYVSSSGNDTTGYGTINKPYATVNKAYTSANTTATIYVMNNITVSSAIDFNSKKTITLTSYSTSGAINSLIRGSSLVDYFVHVSTGNITFEDITIDGNSVTANRASVFCEPGTTTQLLTGATIKNSISNDSHGGGLRLNDGTADNYAQATIDGGTITNNKSRMAGGIFLSTYNKLYLKSGTISNNIAGTSAGLHVIENSTFEMTGGTISGNTADGSYNTGYGGGVGVNGTANIKGGTITGNSAKGYGGGIMVNKGTLNISSGTISDNEGTYGGGIFGETDTTINLTGGSITENTTTSGSGAGIYAKSTVKMSGGSITNNTAVTYGGGIMCKTTCTLSGGSITGNKATNNTGGGLVVDGTATVSGTLTIKSNTASTVALNDIRVSGTFKDSKSGYTANNTTYKVASAINNMYGLNVKGGTAANATNVQIYKFDNKNASKWTVAPRKIENGTVYYGFQSKVNSSYYLWINNNTTKNTENAYIYSMHEGTGGYWSLTSAGSGYYYVKNINGICLEVEGGTAANSQNVRAYTCNNSTAQKWKFSTDFTVASISMTSSKSSGSSYQDCGGGWNDMRFNFNISISGGSVSSGKMCYASSSTSVSSYCNNYPNNGKTTYGTSCFDSATRWKYYRSTPCAYAYVKGSHGLSTSKTQC